MKKEVTAERAVLTSVFVAIFDVILNTVMSIITGSIVMLAEALHGVADFVSASLVYLGLKRSKKKPNREHPFGFGKALYIWTMLATFIMFIITSGLVFYFGLERFLNPEEIENLFFAYIVLTFFIISNGYSFSLGYRRVMKGKSFKTLIKTFKKSNLVESKTTMVLDSIGSLSALIGLIALILYGVTGDTRFDGLGAMAIAATLAFFTIFLFLSTKELLLGKRASRFTENKIKKAALDIQGVQDVLDLKTMHMGLKKILVNIELHVKGSIKISEGEKIMDQVKSNIMKKVPEVYYVQVEIETPDTELKIKTKKK